MPTRADNLDHLTQSALCTLMVYALGVMSCRYRYDPLDLRNGGGEAGSGGNPGTAGSGGTFGGVAGSQWGGTGGIGAGGAGAGGTGAGAAGGVSGGSGGSGMGGVSGSSGGSGMGGVSGSSGGSGMGGMGGTAGTGGTGTARLVAGTSHTCALLVDDSVKCWGYNEFGQLGLGDSADRGDGAGEMGNNLPTVSLGTGRTPKALVAGWGHTCAILDNDSVKCWGLNNFGQLGLGDSAFRGDGAGEMGDNLPTVSLGIGRTAKALALGEYHTCAMLDNDSVKCWGDDAGGQLGLGNTAPRGDGAGEMGDNLPTVSLGTGRSAKALVAGNLHTCAVLDNDSLKCWGYNDHGQLGLGNTAPRGDGAGEMGDNLPTVSLGTGRTPKALVAAGFHTCAILDNDSVKCWGYNNFGQLGLGDSADRGDGAGEMGDNLPTVSLGTGRSAKALVSRFHTCALLDNDSVRCWGYNVFGQLGLGDSADRGDGAGEMGDNLPTVSLGTGRSAKALAAGNDHTCALLVDNSVKCWGGNVQGQLGLGDSASRGDGAGEMGDNLPTVNFE